MTPRAPAQHPRPTRGRRDLARRTSALGLLASVAACTVGPNYVRPNAPLAPTFKEAPSPANGWIVAQPLDAIPKGAWWSAFNDPVLDALEKRVVLNNQTVAAAGRPSSPPYRCPGARTDPAGVLGEAARRSRPGAARRF